MSSRLTANAVLYGYSHGIFPMADPDEDDAVYWFRPDPRAILPLDGFHVSRNLRRLISRNVFRITTDQAFPEVVRACADRESTWISDEIARVYVELYERGFGHSIECWSQEALAGGLYGVAIGGAFFGESMFHRVPNASKVALVHLARHLRRRGFTLLDTQYTTAHLEQFGVIEIPADEYHVRLAEAARLQVSWGDVVDENNGGTGRA